MLSNHIVLFAAGLGTRLRPATLKQPKPCITLNNVPLGYYLIPYINKLNINQFVVNTFYLASQVHDLYKNLNLLNKNLSKIIFSDEKNFIKGSGGGLKQAESYLKNGNPILVCNSDEVFFTQENNFLLNSLNLHLEKKALATLIVTKHPEAGHQFGAIWCDKNNNVIGIGKTPPTDTAIPWHFIGLQFLSPKIFDLITPDLESNIFYDILIHHLENQNIQIYPINADWYETGNLIDYTETKKIILEKLKTEIYYQQHYQELNKISAPYLNTQKLAGLQIGDLA